MISIRYHHIIIEFIGFPNPRNTTSYMSCNTLLATSYMDIDKLQCQVYSEIFGYTKKCSPLVTFLSFVLFFACTDFHPQREDLLQLLITRTNVPWKFLKENRCYHMLIYHFRPM